MKLGVKMGKRVVIVIIVLILLLVVLILAKNLIAKTAMSSGIKAVTGLRMSI